jgi:hypothetical protein
MKTSRDLGRRLAAVERRLARLEGERRAAPAEPATGVAAEGDHLWMIDALRRRAAPAEPGAAGGRAGFAGLVHLGDGSRYAWTHERELGAVIDQAWSESAPVFESLGHRVRLELLRALLRGTHDVAALGALPGIGTSGQVYHHLRALQAAGWVRQVKRNHYAVAPDRAVPLLVMLLAASGPHPSDPPHPTAAPPARTSKPRRSS